MNKLTITVTSINILPFQKPKMCFPYAFTGLHGSMIVCCIHHTFFLIPLQTTIELIVTQLLLEYLRSHSVQ